MATNTYVGARYVPKFDGEWDKTKSYEQLTIVQHDGSSFTSKTIVPVGVDINNTEFWVNTGNYNAQIELYRQQLETLKKEGVFGNNAFDPSISSYPRMDKEGFENALINNQLNFTIDKTPEHSDEYGTKLDIASQRYILYNDNDPTNNENFKHTTNAIIDLTMVGGSNNESEAVTQNFTPLFVNVANYMGGIVGTSSITARTYYPSATDTSFTPNNISLYGGAKGACFDCRCDTATEHKYGGYALCAEFDLVDTADSADAEFYENSDYLNFQGRKTTNFICAGGGKVQPISMGIVIQGIATLDNCFWNGIAFGASAMKINGDYNGHKGTVGISFAAWRERSDSDPNGGYGDICIKYGLAHRHHYYNAGCRNAANRILQLPLDSNSEGTIAVENVVVNKTDKMARFVVGTSDNTSTEFPTFTTKGYFGTYNNQTYLVGTEGRLNLCLNTNRTEGFALGLNDDNTVSLVSLREHCGKIGEHWSYMKEGHFYSIYMPDQQPNTATYALTADDKAIQTAILNAKNQIFQRYKDKDNKVHYSINATVLVNALQSVSPSVKTNIENGLYSIIQYDEGKAKVNLIELLLLMASKLFNI